MCDSEGGCRYQGISSRTENDRQYEIHVLANQPHGWISKAAPLPYFGAAVGKTVGRYQSLKMCCSCWIRHQGVNWEPVLVLAGGCVKIGPCAVTLIHSDCVLGVNALHILCLSLPLH